VTESPTGQPNKSGYRFVGLGLLAGILSALFGVGGGFLVVPLLIRLGVTTKRAAATSLAAVIPIALTALIPYAYKQQVHLGVAALLFAGGVVGASIGTTLLVKVSAKSVQYCFAVLLIVAAIRLAWSVAEGDMGRLNWQIDLGLGLLGVATGVLSGLLGVGGGFIMVPGMMVIASMPSLLAKGTSLAAIIPTAIYGTWRNHIHKSDPMIDWAAAVRVAGGGVIASAVTAVVAVKLDQRLSNAGFAALLLIMAISMWRTARETHSDSA
jgi:uncharacterized protein